MDDINCWLKLVFFKNGGSKFFTDSDSLEHATEEEEINKLTFLEEKGCLFMSW